MLQGATGAGGPVSKCTVLLGAKLVRGREIALSIWQLFLASGGRSIGASPVREKNTTPSNVVRGKCWLVQMVFVTNPMFDLQECHRDGGGMLKWGWTLLDPESPPKVPRRPTHSGLQWTSVDLFSSSGLRMGQAQECRVLIGGEPKPLSFWPPLSVPLLTSNAALGDDKTASLRHAVVRWALGAAFHWAVFEQQVVERTSRQDSVCVRPHRAHCTGFAVCWPPRVPGAEQPTTT